MFSKIASAVGSILNPVRDIIDEISTTDEERMKLQQRLDEIENEAKQDMYKHVQSITNAQKEVLITEMKGSFFQRNWRPHLMYVFMLILVNNFVAVTYIPGAEYIPFPNAFWGLMTLAVSGYIGGRSIEKLKQKSSNVSSAAENASNKVAKGTVGVKPVDASQLELGGLEYESQNN